MTLDPLDEWEQEELQADYWTDGPLKPSVEPPKPLPDPHLAYTQGPAGQTIVDWKAFAGKPTPEQLEIHSTVEDRRDNRDPEQVWLEILERRLKVRQIHGGFKVIDELAENNGQMGMDFS
jgi:hypothetical protein